jgi:hypothetical protein
VTTACVVARAMDGGSGHEKNGGVNEGIWERMKTQKMKSCETQNFFSL